MSRPHFHLTGTLTDACTQQERMVELEARAYVGFGDEVWVRLYGGPTGYESISLSSLRNCVAKDQDWVACFGTPNVWDRLVIPAYEMRPLLEFAELRS